MKIVLMIGFFGVIGILTRYGIDRLVSSLTSFSVPWTTFAINILGSFLLGTVYILGNEKGVLSPALTVALAVGLLGGFTTFSSYTLQTLVAFEKGQATTALSYFLLSPICGLGAAWLGMNFGRVLGL